ncbi:MAG TPA: hypothetical protein VMP01_12105 [Pirellulaceae bacterium]|nr:hypothetical protein [Pirellulaceae bacterium]
MLRFIFSVVLPAAMLAALLPAAAQEIRPDYAIATDPVLEAPPPVPPDTRRLTDLWLVALARPESQMQRQTAEAIVRAHADGIGGLEKSCPALVKIVAAEKSHPAARYAAAQALVALDHKAGAAALRAAAEQHGSLVRQVVEPALARWNDQPIRAVWLARLKDPHAQRRDLLLALAGLGTVREESAAPLCLALAADVHRSADVRLAAARAAGSIADRGWEEQAEKWAGAASAPLIDRLCAAALLIRHQSAQAQEILARLAKDAEPAVASAALAHLHTIDVELVLPLAEDAMRSADANVRKEGAAAYVLRPTPERVQTLAALLDDPHPALRGQVRDDLFRLAKAAELDESVRAAATEMLAGESWRGQEQAALLLAALDHKPAAPRLVELLESKRPEVMVATAWGLRKLAIPETLPAIFDKARRQTEGRKRGGDVPGLDAQVAHLCEALGLMKYAPADPVLREYIPKRQDWMLSRMAGIWALGHLHAGEPDEELALLLIARLTDSDPMNPETQAARVSSALSLGRMLAVSQEPAMRAWMGPEINPEPVDMSIRWALIEMTGEELPPPLAPAGRLRTWFLEPLAAPGEAGR